VSRGPIRDALLTLTKEGFLVARPNVGVRVAAEPSSFKRSVIVRLRREIESAALSAWFEKRDPELIKRLEENLEHYKAASDANDVGKAVELDLDFHRTLVETADGGSLVDLWTPVVYRMYLRYARNRDMKAIHAEHSGVVRSMRSGTEWEAVELLRQHIAYRRRDEPAAPAPATP